MRYRLVLFALLIAAPRFLPADGAECRRTPQRFDRSAVRPRAEPRVDDIPIPPAPPVDSLEDEPPSVSHGHAEPAWQFEKSITLAALRGGKDLPYAGFRGCGPFVVASLLDALDHPLDAFTLEELNELDLERDGTTRREIIGYLTQFFGLTEHFASTTDQLASHIDGGTPALVVVQHQGVLHWCLVTGYQTGRDGQIVSWTLVDNGQLNGQVPHGEFIDIWNASSFCKNYALYFLKRSYTPFMPHEFRKTVQLPTFAIPSGAGANSNGILLVASLLQADGARIDQHALDHISQQIDPDQDGFTSRQCLAYLEQYFDVTEHEPASPELLSTRIDSGRPALIILTRGQELYWSLITGYRLDARGQRFWRVLDEYNGQGEISQENLLEVWHKNYSLFIAPSKSKRAPQFPPAPELATVVQLPTGEGQLEPLDFDACGPLAVGAFVTALGGSIEKAHLTGLVELTDPEKNGTSAEELAAFLGKYFTVTQRMGIDPGRLKSELDAGRPVMLAIDTSGLHWSVLTGYRTDRRGQIVSWDYVQNGQVCAGVSHANFLAGVNAQEWLLFVEPKSNERELKIALLSIAMDCTLATLSEEGKRFPNRSTELAAKVPDSAEQFDDENERPFRLPRGRPPGAQRGSKDLDQLTKRTGPVLPENWPSIPWRYVLMLLAVVTIAWAAAYFTQPKLGTV